jgi:hypothetical protein
MFAVNDMNEQQDGRFKILSSGQMSAHSQIVHQIQDSFIRDQLPNSIDYSHIPTKKATNIKI